MKNFILENFENGNIKIKVTKKMTHSLLNNSQEYVEET